MSTTSLTSVSLPAFAPTMLPELTSRAEKEGKEIKIAPETQKLNW
jgi:hypothetical protein